MVAGADLAAVVFAAANSLLLVSIYYRNLPPMKMLIALTYIAFVDDVVVLQQQHY